MTRISVISAVSLLSLAAVLLLGACVDVESAPEACRDLAATLAQRASTECGEDYDTVYDEFVRTAADGDCSNIVAIRDRDELYDECIPQLESAECPDLEAGELPPSCSAQLIR
jgi:hypothetical protein